MKKIVLTLAAASLIVSCKKVPKGGNHGVLKLEEGVERYDTHERRYEGDHASAHGGHHAGHAEAGHDAHGKSAHGEHAEHGAKKDAHAAHKVDIDLNGVKLHANQGGLEAGLIHFLKSDGYEKAANDEALKSKWYSFDNVNFKMGSSNQLEEGSHEQVKNLAQILKAYPNAKIKIGGYTDKTGKEDVNKKISTDRAQFIKSELAKLGVASQVISAEGYGSEFAKVPATASDEERASDRKMAVRFTK